MFNCIVDLKLNAQQDKVAVLLADGRHPDAHACVIKPVGPSVCFTGVMNGSASGGGSKNDHREELEAVRVPSAVA
jgi:hypothetical protein